MAKRDGALSAIEVLGLSEFATIARRQWPNVLEILVAVIRREGISERVSQTLRAAIEKIDVASGRCRTGALRVAVAVGFAATRVPTELQDVAQYFPESALGGLLEGAARGAFLLERGDGLGSRESLERAVAVARAQGWARGALWSDLQAHLGDAAHLVGDDAVAVAAYNESRAKGNASSFMWIWASWRLGLIRDDIVALGDAADGFSALGLTEMWARALGARGALLLKGGQDLSGLQCFAPIFEAYYVRHDATVGPAVMVAGAHLQRYGALRQGRPLAEDEDQRLPALGPMPYNSIPATTAPRAGPVVALFSLGDAFKRIGSDADARRFLSLSADAVPANETDRITLPLTLSTLIGALGASESDQAEIQRRFKQFLTLQRDLGLIRFLLGSCLLKTMSPALLQATGCGSRRSLRHLIVG